MTTLKVLILNSRVRLEVRDTDRYKRRIAVIYNEGRTNVDLVYAC